MSDVVALVFCVLTGLIYVPYDSVGDAIAHSELRSDAFMLAEAFGGSAALWGGLWLVLSLAAILLCLRYGFGPSSNISFAGGGERVASGCGCWEHEHACAINAGSSTDHCVDDVGVSAKRAQGWKAEVH